MGDGQITWNKKQLSSFHFDLEKVDNEEQSTQILEGNRAIAGYSISFLNWIGKMTKNLEKNDSVDFSLKPDHPVRIDLRFSKLGDTLTTFFLAPRAIEEDFDEDEE